MKVTRGELSTAIKIAEVAGIDCIEMGLSFLKACVNEDVYNNAYNNAVNLVAEKKGIKLTITENGIAYSMNDSTSGVVGDTVVEDALREIVNSDVISASDYIDAIAEEICKITGCEEFEF